MPREFLQRRNALWQALRAAEPGSEVFERLVQELCGLIGWDRTRVLAGLGLQDAPPPDRRE
ncbi:hypothetical protein [Deinococcus navajonensis]|uniref:Uncharacterized protein n=1 Tax=Deinococcus navajonensis TaxID=309884 RepID=A0ABV8XTX2_9DEIO